jgi:hypothetical protein
LLTKLVGYALLPIAELRSSMLSSYGYILGVILFEVQKVAKDVVEESSEVRCAEKVEVVQEDSEVGGAEEIESVTQEKQWSGGAFEVELVVQATLCCW